MWALMKRPYRNKHFVILLISLICLLPWIISSLRFAHLIFLPEFAPSRWLAIVFGAGLRKDGTPTSVLADRVSVAVDLYHQSKISKILMSGSGKGPIQNEPSAMRKLAIQLGVNPEDILIDTGGTRTYETCHRAKDIFNITDAILISQRFHLPRALGICEALAINAVGVSADLHDYGPFTKILWQMREIPATFTAIWDCYFAPISERYVINSHNQSKTGENYES
jgi:SanA protein